MLDKVLVVEDSRAFRKLLENQLIDAGFVPVLCESYAEVKRLLQEHDDYLCAVLDYCLPDAQDGEIIDLVLSYEIKSIVLTANMDSTIRDRVLGKGVIDYILKDSPASISYLPVLLRRLSANRQHKVLVVDDSRTVRSHLEALLNRQYLTCLTAENGQQALNVLAREKDIDFVITDHDMPGKDGIALTWEIRQQHDRSSMIILGLSGSNDKTMTARFIKAGANDFLYKPFNPEEFYCRIHQLLDIKEATSELYKLANQDALTNLWNRRYFFTHAEEASGYHIAMMDIDFFKSINDTYGHDGGDMVLIYVSKLLKKHFPQDVVARFGGEEFAICSTQNLAEFKQRLELFRETIQESVVNYGDKEIQFTLSIGIATGDGCVDSLLKVADNHLYTAKETGRNRIVYD
ncbi:response regulator [Thaumasiovibrio subtropicus]|uniref:response regulator n=1 Tax=Thaumasiovibrio subtropicus TaxID=1891207 RepID=UPI000B354DB5|nr:response regulator [Thaumasiovibrio subtropicus]